MVIVSSRIGVMVVASEAKPIENFVPHILLAVISLRCTGSKVLRDGLEFLDSLTLLAANGSDGVFKAMIEVVPNQRPLGLRYCLFDGVKLLGDVQTRTTALDHGDHAFEVSLGSL
jgi:hypothetical protein